MRVLTQRWWGGRVAAMIGVGLALVLCRASGAEAQQGPPLASRFSAENLVVYVEFAGLDSHATAWKGTAAYKALNETPFGALLEDLAGQGVDYAFRGRVPNPPAGSEVVRLLEGIARRGFAIGVNGKAPGRARPTLVLRGGFRPEVYGTISRLIDATGVNKASWKKETRGKLKVTSISPTTHLIDAEGDLILADSADLDATLATLGGQGANATTHPIVAELSKKEGTYQPVGFAFLDPKMFPPLPPEAVKAGLGGITRVDIRWGFDGAAIQTVARLIAPSPRQGYLALLDGPTFDKSALPPVPAGLTGFTACSVSPADIFDKLVAIATEMDPRAGAHVDQVNAQLGVKLRDDVLARLGPKMAFYTLPGGIGGLPANLVVTGEVNDSATLDDALGKLFDLANASIKRGPRQDGQPQPEVRKLAPNGDRSGYQLVLPPGAVPAGPMAAIKPFLLIGKTSMALATSPEAAAAALDVAEGKSPRWTPADAAVAVMDKVPGNLIFLSIDDPRATMPGLVANLPGIVLGLNIAMSQAGGPVRRGVAPPVPIRVDPAKIPQPNELAQRLFPASSAIMVDAQGLTIVTRESTPSFTSPAVAGVGVALLLPAVQSAREAARRSQCINNLKQMGLAFHNFHSASDRFPAYAITDKAGKPLLSWRVAILPYIEQGELYNKFKLDEPWDSPNNKPLMAEMPNVFRCPSTANPIPGTTTYRTWIGTSTMFEDPKGTTIATVTDGTSNTLLIVEAEDAVPWTMPEGMPFNPAPVPPGIGNDLFGAASNHPGGFNALFCDGSVRFIKKTINVNVLHALITRNAGEVINNAAY